MSAVERRLECQPVLSTWDLLMRRFFRVKEEILLQQFPTIV
jgi:hypothetical protein